MNAATLIDAQILAKKDQPALWLPDSGACSFGELDQLSQRIHGVLQRKGLKPGDQVLLFIDLSHLLYGCILALARAGITAVLVEPWMPLDRLQHVFATVQPQAFLAGRLGQLWGLRVPGVRRIPHWISSRELLSGQAEAAVTQNLGDAHPCIITFTSGTSGKPKGMVRTHGYLRAQHQALNEALHFNQHRGADLCIFANFALANLADGRCSVVIPARARDDVLSQLDGLPEALQPVSSTCGPAFLLRLMQRAQLKKLKALHVGGAQTDCAIFERAFALWPAAEITHVYGSTEAEPVATCDARAAVRWSRERGYFQTLFLGEPWSGLQHKEMNGQLWIHGPHVCPEYLADAVANREHKQKDEAGRLWHRLGDRVEQETRGWWYQGRDHQPPEDFTDEQRIYAAIGSSKAFIKRGADGQRAVYVENARVRLSTIRSVCPDVKMIYETTIRRDRRHQARIDREASLKGATCVYRG
ncbi:AMP-binding protein [Oligoflexus tunisiensis]|uniref:AMP-binding protein n=1 Tax=Oligoflexus tunisiensis TaxID=708132 RepID=UPI00114CBDEC|nr:AMP-binding protein [Oligoflexus tunisiensis]